MEIVIIIVITIFVAGVEPRALKIPGKSYTAELYP